MSALKFAFSLLFCVLLAGQLIFFSGQAYAAEKKSAKPKPKISKSATGPRQCCWPGAICPTPQTDGSPGCKCCGFRVDGKLDQYNGMGIDSTLDVDGNTVIFVVTDKGVDSKLKAIGNGNNGQFVLKQKEFGNSPSPTGHGTRMECIDTGNTSIKDKTVDFLVGAGISDKVFEVTEALLNAVPKYDPELPEDK